VRQTTARLRAPTIYDVAAAAGVSHATVSRAVNGQRGMTDETRHKVLEAVARAGYEPNLAARGLAGRVRSQLAVVVGSPSSPGSARLVGAIGGAARRFDYALTIVGVEPADERSLAHAAERIGEPGVEGAILAIGERPVEVLERLTASSPCVVLGSGATGAVRAVGVDGQEARMLAMEHLVHLGHRQIGCVRAEPQCSDADGGLLLGRGEALIAGYTALIVPTASFALGLIRGLQERGIRVPQDFSVVSLEDHPDAAHFPRPLTAISISLDELAQMAVSALVARIDGRSPGESPGVRARLVVRQTTAPPPGLR
jgi:DNA-binding LacI/PurR family transcriptional regulator